MKLIDLMEKLEDLQYNVGDDARVIISYDSGCCKVDIKEIVIEQSLGDANIIIKV